MESNDGSACNFGFAYDNPKFSDRILSIEIIPDAVAASAAQNRKRSRSGALIIKPEKGEGTSMHGEEQSVNCTINVIEDGTASVKQGEGGDEMIQESSSGDEAPRRNDAARSRDSLSNLRVKIIHVSSAILAGRSPFFYKLFSDGMKESGQRVARLRIHDSEESAMMELLNFLYNNTLSTTMPSGLLEILMIAEKFEVASCIRYCIQRLSSLPMTIESALSYLNLPSSVLQSEGVQLLTDLAKQFIAVQFRNVDRLEDQVLNLSLDGLEAVLSRDDIQVESENAVYDIVLKWAEFNYPSLKERKEVLDTRLHHLIRFPYMSSQKLKKVMTGTDFSLGVAAMRVVEALFFKTDSGHIQRQLVAGGTVPAVDTDHRFVERAYRCRPVKEIELELPRHHTIAYLELKREECLRLFPTGNIYSQTFHLGSRGFSLLARCSVNHQNASQCFGLYLVFLGIGSTTIAVDFDFAAFFDIRQWKCRRT